MNYANTIRALLMLVIVSVTDIQSQPQPSTSASQPKTSTLRSTAPSFQPTTSTPVSSTTRRVMTEQEIAQGIKVVREPRWVEKKGIPLTVQIPVEEFSLSEKGIPTKILVDYANTIDQKILNPLGLYSKMPNVSHLSLINYGFENTPEDFERVSQIVKDAYVTYMRQVGEPLRLTIDFKHLGIEGNWIVAPIENTQALRTFQSILYDASQSFLAEKITSGKIPAAMTLLHEPEYFYPHVSLARIVDKELKPLRDEERQIKMAQISESLKTLKFHPAIIVVTPDIMTLSTGSGEVFLMKYALPTQPIQVAPSATSSVATSRPPTTTKVTISRPPVSEEEIEQGIQIRRVPRWQEGGRVSFEVQIQVWPVEDISDAWLFAIYNKIKEQVIDPMRLQSTPFRKPHVTLISYDYNNTPEEYKNIQEIVKRAYSVYRRQVGRPLRLTINFNALKIRGNWIVAPIEESENLKALQAALYDESKELLQKKRLTTATWGLIEDLYNPSKYDAHVSVLKILDKKGEPLRAYEQSMRYPTIIEKLKALKFDPATVVVEPPSMELTTAFGSISLIEYKFSLSKPAVRRIK